MSIDPSMSSPMCRSIALAQRGSLVAALSLNIGASAGATPIESAATPQRASGNEIVRLACMATDYTGKPFVLVLVIDPGRSTVNGIPATIASSEVSWNFNDVHSRTDATLSRMNGRLRIANSASAAITAGKCQTLDGKLY